MPRPISKDGLDAALEMVRSFGSRKSIPWIPGAIDADPENAPIIRFTPEGSQDTTATTGFDNISAFLNILERLDVAMIITTVDSMTEEMWQDAVSMYQASLEEIAASSAEFGASVKAGSAYAESKEELTQLLREAKAAKPFVGVVATLDVWAITRHPTTMLNCYEATEWWSTIDDVNSRCEEAVQSAEDEQADSPAQVAAQREFDAMSEQRRFWTAEKRKETARQLAAHPDFPRCKTESDKVYLLESLIGDARAADVLKKDIARAAGAVYKFEVAAKKS